MVNIIEAADISNRILGRMNMDFSYIKDDKVIIGNYLVCKESAPISFEHTLRKIESAIINIQMNQLAQILKDERNRQDLKLNLED